jgi:hypothetical protein
MFELLRPDAALRTDPGWPGGGEYRGRTQIEGFMDQFEDSWGEVAYETVGEPEVIGNVQLWPSRWAVRGKASGIETEVDFWGVFTFDGGLFARLDFFFNRNEALEHARSLAAVSE